MVATALEPLDTSEVVILQDLHARVTGYATRARGPGTLRTYRSA